MTKGSFEVSGDPNLLSGYISADVYEIGGVSPTNIIRIDQDWLVRLNWALEGSLKSMICGMTISLIDFMLKVLLPLFMNISHSVNLRLVIFLKN